MEHKITDSKHLGGHDWLVEITLYPKTLLEKSLISNFHLVGEHSDDEEKLVDHLLLSPSRFSLLELREIRGNKFYFIASDVV